MKTKVYRIIKNITIGVLCFGIPVMIILPFTTMILNTLIVITMLGIAFIVIYYSLVDSYNTKLFYPVVTLFIIKTITVFSLFKEVTFRKWFSNNLETIIIDIIPLPSNPAVWWYLVIIIMIIYFTILKYYINPNKEIFLRFINDAAPGMQLSIESDLKNGVLTEQEAMNKRAEIRDKMNTVSFIGILYNKINYEGYAITILFLLSNIFIIIRGYFYNEIFFTNMVVMNILTINIIFILSLVWNTILSIATVNHFLLDPARI